MKTHTHEILGLARILARNPESVRVRKVLSNPPTFEITAHVKDLANLISRQQSFKVIASPPEPEIVFVGVETMH